MNTLNRQLLTISCIAIFVSAFRTGLADDTNQQLISQAEAQYQPVTNDSLAAVRTLLIRDVQNLDQLLSRAPDHVAGWESFLKLSLLRGHILNQNTDSRDSLRKVLQQFSRDESGLGMPQFVRLRHDLAHYLTLLSDQDARDAEQIYKRQLKSLQSALLSYEKDHQAQTLAEVGALLGWFAERRQAGPLLKAIRIRYSHANLRVALSSRLIARVVQREIDLETPFNADLSGNSITGTATTRGMVTATLIPCESSAVVGIRFHGQTDIQGAVDYSPVTAFATGAAGINAGAQVTVDGRGLNAGSPWAAAAANICVYCIQTAFPWPIDPLVVGIQSRQADFNDTAARRAEDEILKQLPGQVDAVIGPLNDQYRWNIRFRLQRLDAFPAHIGTSTTQERLTLNILEASSHQMGAPGTPPIINHEHDAALQLHESALNNVAASMFGDKTFTIREIQELAEDFAGVPAPTTAIAENEEVSIRFDAKQPITISARDDSLTLSITGKEFIAGRRTYPAMTVSVTYQLQQKDGITQATLAADPVIVPPRLKNAERKSLSLRETAIRRLLKNRLDRDLVKTVELKEIPLPSEMRKTTALTINSASASDGWLTVTAAQAN